MPDFSYTGRNASGVLVNGRLQAASADAAASQLTASDIVPIDINEVHQKKSSRPKQSVKAGEVINRLFSRKKIELVDLIIFSRQMFSLTKAGMPLDRALRGLEASIDNLAMKELLKDIASQLEKGQDLAGALGRHPEVFSPLYTSLIHVGENTGRLDQSFQQVGKYLELERETLKQVKSATRYPVFVLVAIAIALTIITMFVIPVFADTFERLEAELPWQTIVLIKTSDFVVSYWPYMLVAIVLSIFSFRRYLSTPKGRQHWDERKLGFPFVGKIFERIALSRFSRTFAMMMRAGVPVVQSLNVISRAVGNRYIGSNIAKMKDSISFGESLYQSASKSGMFSPLVLQMIAVGEESGNVDGLLEEVADFYDAEVEYDLKRLGAAIEPILIIFIAGIVLILALGVFLPIWDLASAAN